ncbi:hypothetical protein [Microcoleus sp. S13_B4]|uniref:hypothetical protein n=1 Tax=Microcoleus sp. S13_B4 TaxID=3055408 RepID=UPI002FCF64CF
MTNENNVKYPLDQPFPKQVFVNLETISNLDQLRDIRLKTLDRQPIQQAQKQLKSYLNKEFKVGKVIGIKGYNGCGKTHLISCLMKTAWEYNHDIQQIYIKAGSSDFLSLYRRIMAQINYQTLQEINTIWLSQIFQKEAEKNEITIEAVNILKQNPNLLYSYLNKSIIPASEITEIHLSFVRRITHNDNFIQAISYLSDPLLGHDVYDWFLGKKLPDDTLRKLGIKHHIDDISIAQTSLIFWVTVCDQIQRPLLLYLDEVENLLIDTTDEIKSANIGILKSLAEVFVTNNCFLCLSAITDVWDILSKNLKNRIQCIELSNLTSDEVLNLMKMFISSSDEVKSFISYEDIYPYTEEAVLRMLLLTNGNISQILDLAYNTFEEAQLNQVLISEEIVKKIAISLNIYFEHQTVIKEITNFFRDSYLKFDKNSIIIKKIHYQYIVIPDLESPIAFLQIFSQSIFSESNIQYLLESTKIINQKYPRAKVILVFCGYIAPEVQERISEIITIDHYLIFYKSANFKVHFLKLIELLKISIKETLASLSKTDEFNKEKESENLLKQKQAIMEALFSEFQTLEKQFQGYIQNLKELEEIRKTQIGVEGKHQQQFENTMRIFHDAVEKINFPRRQQSKTNFESREIQRFLSTRETQIFFEVLESAFGYRGRETFIELLESEFGFREQERFIELLESKFGYRRKERFIDLLESAFGYRGKERFIELLESEFGYRAKRFINLLFLDSKSSYQFYRKPLQVNKEYLKYIILGIITSIALVVSVSKKPELLASIILFFSHPLLWDIIALVGASLLNYWSFKNDEDSKIKFISVTIGVIYLGLVFSFFGGALLSNFVLVIDFIKSPIIFSIISLVLSLIWLSNGIRISLNKTKRELDLRKRGLNYMSSSIQQEYDKMLANKSRDRIIMPLVYSLPFATIIATISFLRIFGNVVTWLLTIIGGILFFSSVFIFVKPKNNS